MRMITTKRHSSYLHYVYLLFAVLLFVTITTFNFVALFFVEKTTILYTGKINYNIYGRKSQNIK